jgi:hypothetical protein
VRFCEELRGQPQQRFAQQNDRAGCHFCPSVGLAAVLVFYNVQPGAAADLKN